MKLLVDIGNSNIKWCFSNTEKLGKIQSFQYSFETIERLLSSHLLNDEQLFNIKKIYICNVAGNKIKSIFSSWMASNVSATVIYFESSKQQLGVKNAYSVVSNLGNDRWLSLIYAHQFYQSDVCIIDCGTAITIDVVLKSGQHAGGLIAPGYSSQIAALNFKTDIKTTEKFVNQRKSGILQNNTHDCIEHGCRLMSLGFIKNTVIQLTIQNGDTLKVVLTGGDAKSLATDLPSDWLYNQNLIFLGLQMFSNKKVS